jgi:ABC-type transport system involved in multi-copper enzyme maturation permease subunit
MCWNLSEFLDGGLPAFKYLTLVKSISVDAVTIFILFAFAYAIFKRKDIKNQ